MNNNEKQIKGVIKDKRLDRELSVIGYFQDRILKNRWKEYHQLHNKILKSIEDGSDYDIYSDKIRELEKTIEDTLNSKVRSLNISKTMGELYDRDKRNQNRLGY